MNTNHTPDMMKRKELEINISEAADGMLTPAQRHRLEKELEAYPELMQDYRDIMNLPDFSGIYGTVDSYRNDSTLNRILTKLNKEGQPLSFNDISLTWFRKYALAASLLILAATSVFYFSQPDLLNGEFIFDEFLYLYEESSSDDYILYLNDWMDN